jgi:hypothetical protein
MPFHLFWNPPLGAAVEQVAKDVRGFAKGMTEKEAATPEES